MRFLAGFFLSVFCSFVVAATETPWVQHGDMLSTRVVMASEEMQTDKGVLFAWEAKLAPGWKTYWRSPGEAGLPVKIFQGGKELEPLYPLPERFELFGIQTFGYGKQLLLPFRSKLHESDQATFQVDFMVCKEICVPFVQVYNLSDVKAGLKGSLHDIRFGAWLKKVPDTQTALHGMKIEAVRISGPVGHQKLIVDVSAKCDLSNADLFVEADNMAHFGLPSRRLLQNGNKARLVLSVMNGGKPKDLREANLRLTFTDGHGIAIDRKYPSMRLDN